MRQGRAKNQFGSACRLVVRTSVRHAPPATGHAIGALTRANASHRLQIPPRQLFLRGGVHAQHIHQIRLHAAIVVVDPVQRRIQKLFLHAPQHAQHFFGRVAAHAGRALVERVGEQVVVHDHIARHAQGEQDEGGGKAGAVFAGGAVDDGGRVAGQQQAKQFGKARGVGVHKAPIGFLHQRHGVLCGELAAGALQLEGALHHGGFDGQRVVGHAGELVGLGRAFGLATKVHRPGHAQVGLQGLVLRREASQVVGAKEPPPFHRPPAMAGVAAQVAEIGDAGKRQGA